MTTVIRHTGDPYPTARAIDRALEGHHWRVVVMHAEDGGVIRIAPRDANLFDAGVLVLAPGERLIVSDTGGLQIEPDIDAEAWARDRVSGR
jgi:hypothetical protein